MTGALVHYQWCVDPHSPLPEVPMGWDKEQCASVCPGWWEVVGAGMSPCWTTETPLAVVWHKPSWMVCGTFPVVVVGAFWVLIPPLGISLSTNFQHQLWSICSRGKCSGTARQQEAGEWTPLGSQIAPPAVQRSISPWYPHLILSLYSLWD